MKTDETILSKIEIAKPCTANWETMTGDEQVRACGLCHLNVYNISTMTEREADSFLRQRLPESRVCVRLYRRHDGTIISDNCPRGLRAARDLARRVRHRVAAVASILLPFLASLPGQSQNANQARTMGEATVPTALMGAPAVCHVSPTMEAYTTKMRGEISKAWKLPQGASKKVSVSFKIKSDGSVSDLKIDSSSGNKKLDQKALAAVRKAAPFDSLPPQTPDTDEVYTFQ